MQAHVTNIRGNQTLLATLDARYFRPHQIWQFPRFISEGLNRDHHPASSQPRSSATPSVSKRLQLLFSFLCFFTVACPLRSQTPATFVGLHIHSGVLSSQPWPSVPIGSIRLWDTRTGWNDLEPSKGVYSWSNLDGHLALAQKHNLDVLYTFGQTAEWAASGASSRCTYGPGSCFPPSNIQDWDDFVTAVVAHSAGRIKYWELWNEANYPSFWMGDMHTLVTLAQHAYKIIKAADPKAVVLCPSSTVSPPEVGNFLKQYFAAGGTAVTDAIAFHGYVNYTRPSLPEAVLDYVTAVRGAMASSGIAGKPIWNTEGSWGLNTALASPSEGPGYLAREFILQWSSGVSRFYWYAWNNTHTGTLWATNGVQPAGIAYEQIYNWLVGATMTKPCTMATDSTWVCAMTRPGGFQALAVWNSATTKTYTPAAEYTKYLDLAGNTKPVSGAVTIGYSPILLVSSTIVAPPTNVNATAH